MHSEKGSVESTCSQLPPPFQTSRRHSHLAHITLASFSFATYTAHTHTVQSRHTPGHSQHASARSPWSQVHVPSPTSVRARFLQVNLAVKPVGVSTPFRFIIYPSPPPLEQARSKRAATADTRVLAPGATLHVLNRIGRQRRVRPITRPISAGRVQRSPARTIDCPTRPAAQVAHGALRGCPEILRNLKCQICQKKSNDR